MPFPLAHPAAVLPLRRCRSFDFAALVIGSITPDLAYLSGPFHLEDLSHSLPGAILFCLPAGLLAFWGYRRLALRVWPASRNTDLAQPLSLRGWARIALSLLVGTLTHLLWDSFTHKSGWFVQRLPLLRLPLTTMFGHQVRVFHVLWYGCSFAGVALLYIVYERTVGACPGACRSA